VFKEAGAKHWHFQHRVPINVTGTR
jgi:hypothetical protein